MDPVSLVLGVAPLVAQIAKLGFTIKAAVESYKSVPKEVQKLVDRLDWLEKICISVDATLTRHQSLLRIIEPVSLSAISEALTRCQAEVQRLEEMIASTGMILLRDDSSKTQTPCSKNDTVSRGRFLRKKDKIQGVVQDLDGVINSLQLAITLNIW